MSTGTGGGEFTTVRVIERLVVAELAESKTKSLAVGIVSHICSRTCEFVHLPYMVATIYDGFCRYMVVTYHIW
jgi:hypothetical protein